ncbi:MAG: hypothetical protein K2M91_04560 [Lachnospiraceae bacterium]|nr:hypothetical protein [Lachnospiraceae bacterium]
MSFNLSNLMSDYYLNSLYSNGLYGQYNNAFYLGGLYGQNNVLGNVQDYSSFQNILAASLNGQRLQNSSILEAQMQAGLNETGGKYAVVVPPELEKKLKEDSTLAQDIMGKISTLMIQQDTIPGTIDSFSVVLDEDGNISSYRFSGGGGQKTLPTEKESQKSREEHAENMRHQVRKHHL